MAIVLFCVLSVAMMPTVPAQCEKEDPLLPGFHDRCVDECRKPYVCAEDPSEWRRGPGRICSCMPPYKKDGSIHCYLECSEDEIYENYECKKRCSNSEIRSENGTCLEVGYLGHRCESKKECIVPFSECSNGECRCLNGFVATDETTCTSRVYSCPNGGEAFRTSDGVLRCNLSPEGGEVADSFSNCPPGYTCRITAVTSISIYGSTWSYSTADGHCCPLPNYNCPVGEPHSNATCSTRWVQEKSTCPKDTHECYEPIPGSLDRPLCCPRACHNTDQVYVHGRCYERRKHGDRCELDQQCDIGRYMICDNGRCLCKKGTTTEIFRSSNSVYCTPECAEDERRGYGYLCDKIPKIGDPCDPKKEICGDDALCSKNQSVCVCKCDKIQISPHHCGPKPRCQYGNVSEPITLCRANDTMNSSMSLVESCPTDQYCQVFPKSWDQDRGNHDFGVCCPKPAMVKCPDGKNGTVKCDPSNPNACGLGFWCWQYLKLAAPEDPMDGHVCCAAVKPQ